MKRWTQGWISVLFMGFLWSISGCSSDEGELDKPEHSRPTQPGEEEYTYLPVEYRKWQNGSFQSWTTQDSRETRTIDGMNWFHPVAYPAQTVWGGRTDLQLTSVVGKEGFFRVATCEGRSFLLDPADGAFLIHGIQHVRPGSSAAQQQAIQRKFGSLGRWSEETGRLLVDNQFNYISYGSKRAEAFPAEMRLALLSPASQQIAYAENLYLLRSFMWDMHQNLGYTFEDDKYNRLVLLFEPTFASYIDELIREKSLLFAGDKHFIGYYLDNELPFASYQDKDPLRGIDLKHFLSLPDRYKSARLFAERFMHDRQISTKEAVTSLHQEEFRGRVADYYFQLTTSTLRRYDTVHLILGARLHDWSKYNQQVVKACARYCDVVSINYYARWQPEQDFLAKLDAWCGTKPFLISEFYVKAADAGYDGKPYNNTEGGGWLVRNQQHRGAFHQNFCLRLLESRRCIGWVHFEYNDAPDANKGIVSLDYEPYEPYLKLVRQLNQQVHALVDYYDNRKNK